jgi:predicted transposase YbfD/YdcC
MLKSFLFKIKDHRRQQGRRYELGHILLFSILAILSGANSYRKVALFMATHYEKLDEMFGLKWKRKPAHTSIREIIKETNSEELEKVFREYSRRLSEMGEGQQFIEVDGKVLRGSFDHFFDQKAIQILSAFVSDSRIILAHEEIEQKTNEIPVARKLFEELGVTAAVFVLDALHCQAETLEVAQATGNDVIVQVKENQKTLFNDCVSHAATHEPDAVYQEPTTKSHNRIERRQVELFLFPFFSDPSKWEPVEVLVKVNRFRKLFHPKTKTWRDTHETAFYLSTLILDAQLFCHVIRNHWGIENRDHYVRDVTLGEDASRIRVNPQIFAKLRSFALNIFRHNSVENVSQETFINCLDFARLALYSGLF